MKRTILGFVSLNFPSPILINPESVPSLRWGVLGTGNNLREFVSSTLKYTRQKILSIAPQNSNEAQLIAAEFNIPYCDENLEKLASREDIDAIFISSHSDDHLKLTLKAISAGKNVLVEQPIATNPQGVKQIFEAANKHGVFVMESMPNRYHPQSSVVRQILSKNLLGKPKLILINICEDRSKELQKRDVKGKSTLFDLGIYPVSLALEIMGHPLNIQVIGKTTPLGTEAEMTVFMDFEWGARCIFTISSLSNAPQYSVISCEKGVIEYQSSFVNPSGILVIPEGSKSTPMSWIYDDDNQFQDSFSYQTEAFAHFVSEGVKESPIHSPEESMAALEIIHEIAQQLGVSHSHEKKPAILSYEHSTRLLMW